MSSAAPFYSDLAQARETGTAYWIHADDGVRLRVAHWTNDSAKGTVLLFPGRTEYIEKYGKDADELLSRGLATLVIDWRGQGLADRLIDNTDLGHVGQFTDYQRDVAAMVGHARAIGLPEPFYLLAHSMGGCIGLRALHNGLPVAAASFSAPMWGIKMSPVLRGVAWGVSTIGAHAGFGTSVSPGQSSKSLMTTTAFADNPLTNDPDMYAYMVGQVRARSELGLGGPTIRWLNEALREMRFLAHQKSPHVPCVTWLGTEESIVDPAAIRQRMAKWPNGRLEILDRCKHEVLMERPDVRQQIFDDLGQFFSTSPIAA